VKNDPDAKRFAALREISHFTRHGVVEGVEFDLRHSELDPRHWGMFLIGDKDLRSDRQPFIWFPWDGIFDREAIRRSITKGPPKETCAAAVRRMLEYLTPEAFAYAGDKLCVDEVKVLHSNESFAHRHDSETRLAFLKIIRRSGRIVRLKTPIRMLGHTSLLLGNRGGAAARISESSVKVVCGRQHLAIVASAGFDDFERDEALDVGAELGEILRRRAGAILLQRAIDHALRR
jgi:hypothetical protein